MDFYTVKLTRPAQLRAVSFDSFRVSNFTNVGEKLQR